MSFASVLSADTPVSGSARLRSACGRMIPLPVARWWADPEPAEERVLSFVLPGALDIGCGPARHTLELARRGVHAVGIDHAPEAVRAAHERGARAILGDVFAAVPREGAWGSALLLDGNIGIGGDPERLLRRVHELLRPGGRVLMELERPGSGSRSMNVRTEHGERVSGWFGWAQLAVDDLPRLAIATGYEVSEAWHAEGRWFARMEAR